MLCILNRVFSITIHPQASSNKEIHRILNTDAHWKLWQTGLDLYTGDILIFKLREIPIHSTTSPYRIADSSFKIKQDGIWSDVDLSRLSILEIYFPLFDLTFHDVEEDGQVKDLRLSPNPQNTTRLLSLCVDHVDILLEDWYPTLGTRFVHTSEGRFLVTRLIPCVACLRKINNRHFGAKVEGASKIVNEASEQEGRNGLCRNMSLMAEDKPLVVCGNSILSRASFFNENSLQEILNRSTPSYTWTIEECILATYDNRKTLVCPFHGEVNVSDVAPDLVTPPFS